MRWHIMQAWSCTTLHTHMCPWLRSGMMRWHIMYNLVVLRLVSFGMDLHWARKAAAAASKQQPLQPAADDASLKVHAS